MTIAPAELGAARAFSVPQRGKLHAIFRRHPTAMAGAILRRDYPIIQGVILLFSASYVLVNLAVDISYTFLDPRIRY